MKAVLWGPKRTLSRMRWLWVLKHDKWVGFQKDCEEISIAFRRDKILIVRAAQRDDRQVPCSELDLEVRPLGGLF